MRMTNTEFAIKKTKSFINKTLFILLYIAVFIGIVFGAYYLYLSYYDFYFEEPTIEVELGETKKSEITTVRTFDVKDGDYVYTIKNDKKKIATVDSKGNVRGITVGVAVLEVRYKNSIFPKTQKIVVVPKTSEEQVSDSDNSQELELPF